MCVTFYLLFVISSRKEEKRKKKAAVTKHQLRVNQNYSFLGPGGFDRISPSNFLNSLFTPPSMNASTFLNYVNLYAKSC